MQEISSHFALITPESIQDTLRLQRVTFIPVGAIEFACTNPVSVSQTPTASSAGTTWDINFRAVTTDNEVRDYNGRRLLIGIIMADGSARIIGNASEAPMITVTPYASANQVSASFKSAVPLDL